MKSELEKSELVKQKESNLEILKYGTQRFDLLVVSLSGGGIYVCLETFKYLHEVGKEYESLIEVSNLVPITGSAFLLAIILNFLSQATSMASSNSEDKSLSLQIDSIKNELTQKETCDLEKHNERSERFNNTTNWLNQGSAVVMFTGLILILVYFTFVFP
jgi:hypothetical protein